MTEFPNKTTYLKVNPNPEAFNRYTDQLYAQINWEIYIYHSNNDFKDYVDRICNTYDVPLEKALRYRTVAIVAEYYRDNNK